MSDVKDILRRNLAEVEERIAAACQRSGRRRDEVTLVAVTKYVDIEVARLLLEFGVRDLGESRPQELWRKAAAIPEARWHLVGHLQRNKVERTFPLVRVIHSVDSIRLLEALEREAEKLQRCVAVLLEFNLNREPAKHGFHVSQVPQVLAALRKLRMVPIAGLMTMAALNATPEQSRPTFAALRELLAKLRSEDLGRCLPTQLSMGMTSDFEIAIEEGATIVRIGSALFQGMETRPHD